MPVSNVAYGYWHKGEARIQYADGREELHYLKPKPLEMFKQALTLVHGIVTPSQKLCDDWARFSYSVLLPNYFEIDNYINHVPPKHDGIFIGWGGSMSHFQSFTDSGVLEALSRIIHKRNDVKLLIAGDKRVYDKVRLPEGKKLFQPYVPHVSWPRVVEQFDIGIAPLCGEYDKRRSWIKPMEYMMLRKPWIASDVGTYDSIRDYGNLTKNYPKKWEEAIDNVLNSIEGQSLKVSNGYEFALKNADVDKNVDNIIAVYQDIADHAGIKIQ
jgi:glycosyltransferase involved in cell wall biosynthesis